jgi:hypothetical protein
VYRSPSITRRPIERYGRKRTEAKKEENAFTGRFRFAKRSGSHRRSFRRLCENTLPPFLFTPVMSEWT